MVPNQADDGDDLQEENGVLRERRRRGLEEHPGQDVPQGTAASHPAKVQQGAGKCRRSNLFAHSTAMTFTMVLDHRRREILPPASSRSRRISRCPLSQM